VSVAEPATSGERTGLNYVEHNYTTTGDCTFTPLELVSAFLDLVLCAEYGVKPAT